MAHVRDLLDLLAAGDMTVEKVAANFRARKWPKPVALSDAETWGVVDRRRPAPDSWEVVSADSRLSPDDYQTLGEAYREALAR